MVNRHMDRIVLSATRWRIARRLTGVVFVIYFGFLLLIAYQKPLLGWQLVPGLSLGILCGALVIVSAWALTGLYVMIANRLETEFKERSHD